MLLLATSQSEAMSWKIACSVDSGSIESQGSTYVFRTSNNHCPGGIFNQRAEITSPALSVSTRVTHVFSSTISMRSKANEPFILFQIHDGRLGCSPPMSLRWTRLNTLSFDSDYTMGKGMDGCVQNRSLRDARYAGPDLKRDGTKYQLQAAVAFDGKGAFDIDVSIDGNRVLSGTYTPPNDGKFVRSSKFFMKHGVYSQQRFDYEMRSEGIRLAQGR
jgi:hypothetical protein